VYENKERRDFCYGQEAISVTGSKRGLSFKIDFAAHMFCSDYPSATSFGRHTLDR